MLKTIEQKLAAIKTINAQKDQVDSVIQKMDLNPDKAFEITVNGQAISNLLFANDAADIKKLVKQSLANTRDELISKATELMK